MVAVTVFDAIDDFTSKLFDQSIPLIPKDMLESFLNDLRDCQLETLIRDHEQENDSAYPTPVHLQRELVHITLHPRSKVGLLILITNLKQFLNHIVPKDIHHEREHIRFNLGQDGRSIFICTVFESLLDESGSMLITTELDHVPGNVLDKRSAQYSAALQDDEKFWDILVGSTFLTCSS